ncbi:hypothetical protein MALGJ_24400 [Mycolicibacter algericus]|uniref:Uncharacterized protein n=1 Tax=Mycolicibacter algericus TaxID=1288388 RepID=A0A7I9YAZ1_MYCAL|nr:hypothetical protein MALGJ_24400 [Mycolicibacter algericus]
MVATVLAFPGDTTGLRGHQGRDGPYAGGSPQPVALDLGDDVHDAPIDGIALTGQLRQLAEQHLKPLVRAQRGGAGRRRRCGRGHDVIMAVGYDKSGLPDSRRGAVIICIKTERRV